MIPQRSQSRKRKLSSSTKTKLDIQLPKINKTTLLIKDRDKQKQKQNISSIPSFSQRVAWVIESTDYSVFSEKQIFQQYNKLRRQLQIINEQVAKQIEKIDFKALKKSKLNEIDPTKILQVRDKQVQNNNAIVDRLRKEYEQLQKRVLAVSGGTKDQIQQQIQKTKGDLQKIKKKIKQLKMKNKTIGDSIMNSDDLYDEIRRLQNERQANQRKKYKLQTKTDQVYEQISTSQLKLQEINDNYLIAQNFFEEYQDKNQITEQQKQLQYKLRHSKHCLQIVTRKNDISNNSKQQKYHISLKNLQNQIGKLDLLQQKTASVELQIIHCKKLLAELQQLYKKNQGKAEEILNQGPLFFTQFQAQNNQKQQKDSKIANKTVTKINKANINNYQTQKKDNIVQRNKTQSSDQPKLNSLHIQIRSQQHDKNSLKPQSERINNLNNNKQHSQKQQNKQKQKTRERQRIQTSNGIDAQQQQDIIQDLDEKFKYKTKYFRNSRYNEKQTQLAQQDRHNDQSDPILDQDDQIMDFKNKISAQKIKRKSNDKFNIVQDIQKVKDHIEKSMEFRRASKSQGSEEDMDI